MSFAAITAKSRGVTLRLGRADTGGYWCRGRITDRSMHTWTPEEVTCKKCLKAWRERNRDD